MDSAQLAGHKARIAVIVSSLLMGLQVGPVCAQGPPHRPADIADSSYGPDPRHLLDLYLPSGDDPSPLVVWFPGGGFIESRKEVLYERWIAGLLDRGIAIASVQYRLAPEHPLPAAFEDARRAIQFLRLNADRYGLDADRIAASGDSAGAGLSLWLALHDELAASESDDPMERQSTRLTCAVVIDAQASYDPRFWVSHGLGRALLEDPFSLMWGLEPDAVATEPFDDEALVRVAQEVSPINHVSGDDPPVLDSVGVHSELLQQDPASRPVDVLGKSVEYIATCLTSGT